jgi:hypothetical protein
MKNYGIIQPFDDRGSLNLRAFYYQQFGKIPHDIEDYATYLPEVVDAIREHYENDPLFNHYTRAIYLDDENTTTTNKFNAILTDGLVVSCTGSIVRSDWELKLFYNGDKSLIDEFYSIVKPFRKEKKKERKSRLFMIVNDRMRGFALSELPIEEMCVSVDRNYNDDFLAVHSEVEKFVENDKSGLVILHGKQGTGKSSYIRHIISSTKKRVIYITSDMADSIASPNFIQFIMKQKGSLIVLEDCEELLAARSSSGRGRVNTGLTNILNMSDGLLGDALQLKFVCTFNAPLRDIDKALLRKGRLVARYEFNDLTPEKANALIAEQNLDVPQQLSPISLADLYHYEKPAFEQEKRVIGF